MLFRCKRCREMVRINDVKKNPNNKVRLLRRLRNTMQKSALFQIKPNVSLCFRCLSELLCWANDSKTAHT